MTLRPGIANVFSIPSGEPFLTSLAAAVLDGTLPNPGTPAPDPVSLSDYRILLPTRRAVRSLSEAFLDLSSGAQLLPHMTPLGDVDEDELLLGAPPASELGDLTQKPAISALDRRLVLTGLILDWVARKQATRQPSIHSPAQAAVLAADLARLIDMFDTEQADWSALETLVDHELSGHWDDALSFLNLLRVSLPDLLEARGVINPIARRNLLLAAEAARLEQEAQGGPVIAAGSTGSIPATANLLRIVAGLPNGALVLPGLDTHLHDEAWACLGPDHPQYGLKQLLDRIGIARTDVRDLSRAGGRTVSAARSVFLSEVMRPADATEHWGAAIRELASGGLKDALDGIRRVTAPTQRDEALAIALIMRATLDVPGQTVALVTPDRRLARRVSAELSRWTVAVDDSAGVPLSSTPQATFALLLAETVASGFAAVPLLALLKHPLARFGLDQADTRRLAGLLEVAALRGLAPSNGIDGLRRAVQRSQDHQASPAARQHPIVARLTPEDWQTLSAFLERLAGMLEPMSALFRKAGTGVAGPLLRAHIACAEAAAQPASPDTEASPPASSPLWQGDGGETLASFFSALIESEHLMPPLAPPDYGAFLSTLMQGHVVRARFGQHPRLAIWGLLEARLMQADVIILGGLNEGVWPPQAMTDPWLNRPMRAGLDLEPPERRIGLTAHDFVQAAAARHVYLTTSEKIDGTPAVPSRWLLRLDALLGGLTDVPDLEDRRWVSWALGMDHTDDYHPIGKPAPRPPLTARPRAMSVTQVETWIRDPYAIFARTILGLEPVPPLAADPSAADRGTIIHEILHRAAHAGGPVALETLLQTGGQVFQAFIDYPDVAAFWWPRFERAARWLVEQGHLDDADVAKRLTEMSGNIDIDAPGGPFKLRARADRIDVTGAGQARIIDYKTGQLPTDKQIASGLSPQLSLEAAIAMQGGFRPAGRVEVDSLELIKLSGGEPPGEWRAVKAGTVPELANAALAGLRRRIAAFDNEQTPYLPRVVAETERQQRDYDHLARHMEWARQAAEDGEP